MNGVASGRRDGISPPAANAVHVWVVPLEIDESQMALYHGWLSVEERARAGRFLLEEIRRRFIACRGCLRELLGAMLDTAPDQVRFEYSARGKPRLVGPQGNALHFNVTHSRQWALIAVARSPVGVDLEIADTRVDYRVIASQILSAVETREWERMTERWRERDILDLWVCKEALLKALGVGIADGLRRVHFALPISAEGPFAPRAIDGDLQLQIDEGPSCRRNHWMDAAQWRLRIMMLDALPAEAHAALCVPSSIREVKVLDCRERPNSPPPG